MSDSHGLQQDSLWQSSNTRPHSCSQKASKQTSGQFIVGLSVHLHSTTAPWRIHHYAQPNTHVRTRPISRPDSKACLSSNNSQPTLNISVAFIVTSLFKLLRAWLHCWVTSIVAYLMKPHICHNIFWFAIKYRVTINDSSDFKPLYFQKYYTYNKNNNPVFLFRNVITGWLRLL
jgi:hypothetical protein